MNLLLLDAAFSAVPIYNALIAGGHNVWVMGNRATDVLARKAGGRGIDQNYGHVADVARFSKLNSIDRIVPGCTDVSIETCLQLVEGGESEKNKIISDKGEFREICRRLDLPSPRRVYESQFPLPGIYICKPVDAFSGRGIAVFDGSDMGALKSARGVAERESRSSCCLFETFAQGDLYSCSLFLEAGRIVEVFYVREGSSVNPYAVDTSYVCNELPGSCTNLLESSLERMSDYLHLSDGLLHVQFIFDGSQPYIVEVTRRCPGDLYSLLIEYSTGYKYAEKYASYFLGVPCDASRGQERYVLRHTVASGGDAVYGGLKFNESVAVKAFFPIQMMGGELLANQANRAGVLFSELVSYEDLISQFKLFMSRGAYTVGC